MLAVLSFSEWEILLGLFSSWSTILYCEGGGGKFSFSSQINVPRSLGLIERTVYHPKAQDFGIEAITGGDLVLSPSGQMSTFGEESTDYYVMGQSDRL